MPSFPRRRSGALRAAPAARGALVGVLLGAIVGLAGCERKAPGPEECVAFAEAWMRARKPATRLEADTAFDELVRRCLTEPYDRELVTCVVSGEDQERCRIGYVRRKERQLGGGAR